MFKLPNFYPRKPFGRSLTMRMMLNEREALPVQLQARYPTIHPYFSRGKGHPGMRPTSGIPADNKCNNSFDPPGHNGAREMARRVRQRSAQL